MESISLIIASVITSLILYQSVFIAPSVNKLLQKDEAGILLRHIWPKFFIIIGLLSFVSFLIELFKLETFYKYLSLTSFLFMMICYFITPSINKAKDNLKEQLWFILHLATVFITLITLILNVIIIYYKISS
ncbi:MAG: Uncharacterised protein [Flavobacterium sp. SCGC AAA160-P02]|nr:MAG: Uncharacterised protein [Flavobacterium sp. SCGC AAA160-P02]